MRTFPERIIASLTLLSVLAGGCGPKSSGGSGPDVATPGTARRPATPSTPGNANRPTEEETNHTVIPTDGSNIDGYYLAKFETLNPHVNGTIPGSATFYRKEDRLFAYLRLFAGAPKAWHQQKVYTGDRCPTMADDKNRDGYIDIVEAEAAMGKVLIPMDSDIGTQMSGRNFYPVGDLSGSYHYERVVSFKRFFADLKAEDKNLEDNIVKLAADEPLVIEGRPVMIQGTAETIEYPETVASTNRHRPHQTLPIACGIFKKADVTPGTPDDGEIPGPIADVMEDQDRPSEGPEGTSSGNGNVNTETTNESERGESETEDEHGNRSTGGSSGGSSTGGTTGGSTGGSGESREDPSEGGSSGGGDDEARGPF